MSEQKKYVTFRDLKDLPQAKELISESSSSRTLQSLEELKPTSDSSIPSTTRYTSTTSDPSISSSTSISKNKSAKSLEKEKFKQLKDNVSKKHLSVAPERDFQRVPNSVTRQALPSGIFRGKSKQVWDYLWSVSRGAISPVRIIKKSRREIKIGTGIGSMVTVDAAITHLVDIGLLRVLPAVGSLNGNAYEIFTPEENGLSSSGISSISSISSLTQKLDILDIPETSISSILLSPLESSVSGDSKTFFKTSDDDDLTHTLFREFNQILIQAAENITGMCVRVNDREKEKWIECATIIAKELERAASKTEGISSVPAFLASHLKRAFLKGEQKNKISTERIKSHGPKNSKEKVPTTKEAARAESKFTLSECLQYAQSLERKGVYNPGGYATTIYRTGEADALVAEFLNTRTKKALFSDCPDCKGQGLYYPENSNQIEVKCQHPKLRIVKLIREAMQELKLLHKDDSSYQEADLLEDLKYRCGREDLEWDELLALKIIR